MNYQVYYKGKRVAIVDALGSHFVQSFKFKDQGESYLCHEISFNYEKVNGLDNVFDIVPSTIEKVWCFVDGFDEWGIKFKYKRDEIDVEDLKNLTDKIDLWGNKIEYLI